MDTYSKPILTVVGARPQFVKAAVFSRLVRTVPGLTELLVHTGQHYDDAMSATFFRELSIPEPDLNLEVGSGPHGRQTGRMLEKLESVMLERDPALVLVYGDTNSTLAGALAAAKLGIPVAHVEAGLRSHNWSMPEEINRVLSDRLSAILLCPSEQATMNLRREGIAEGVHLVGDIMYDAVLTYQDAAMEHSSLLARLGLREQGYVLATIHRAENTDSSERLSAIIGALHQSPLPVIFPIHPRTLKALQRHGISVQAPIHVTDPLGYLDMIRAQSGARAIVTDSGGVQKEAYWLGVPCITARTETEWVETVEAGWNLVAGSDPGCIARALIAACEGTWPAPEARASKPSLYGDGNTGARIREIVLAFLSRGGSPAVRR